MEPVTALAHPVFDARQLSQIREMAHQGMKQHVIRRAMGISLAEWRTLAAPETPVAIAIEEGIAAGQSEVIRFMREKMIASKSESAAQWLAENVYQLTGKDKAQNDEPRIVIQINNAMQPDTYMAHITARRSDPIESECPI